MRELEDILSGEGLTEKAGNEGRSSGESARARVGESASQRVGEGAPATESSALTARCKSSFFGGQGPRRRFDDCCDDLAPAGCVTSAKGVYRDSHLRC